MDRVVERSQNSGNLVDQLERLIVGQRIAAGKQQAGAELYLDPQLVAPNRQLVIGDQLAECLTHALCDALKRIERRLPGAWTGEILDLRNVGLGGARSLFTDGNGLDRTVDWLNTPTSESERILYLPSLIEEMEYITTKKANSKVMKSAYETSQRSWFSCSSGALRLAMALSP